jgi:hypothetical protein
MQLLYVAPGVRDWSTAQLLRCEGSSHEMAAHNSAAPVQLWPYVTAAHSTTLHGTARQVADLALAMVTVMVLVQPRVMGRALQGDAHSSKGSQALRHRWRHASLPGMLCECRAPLDSATQGG